MAIGETASRPVDNVMRLAPPLGSPVKQEPTCLVDATDRSNEP